MGDNVNVDIRPCMYLSGGEYRPGLFHRWMTLGQDHIWLKKGTFVALIESESGVMSYVQHEDIYFTDTKKQMERFGMRLDSEGNV